MTKIVIDLCASDTLAFEICILDVFFLKHIYYFSLILNILQTCVF